METILITGATGTIGKALLAHLKPAVNQQVCIASRNKVLKGNEVYFDFENLPASRAALAQTQILFLLRPPQLSNVKKHFYPLLDDCKKLGVQHIIFLSVQGADTTPIIPHAKIEKYIQKIDLGYTFIRPSYFMQNLTTSFLTGIKEKAELVVPAGTAPFLWVDADDIGKAIAAILKVVHWHKNKAYTLTGNQTFTFGEVAALLSAALKKPIQYKSPGLLNFYFHKRKEGMAPSFIWVMIALHFAARFQKPPQVSTDFTSLTGQQPASLQHFIERHKKEWLP